MSPLFATSARLVQLMCNVCKISLSTRFDEHYIAFPLNEYGVSGDFFIRSSTVGISIKHNDAALFYLLQDKVLREEITLLVKSNNAMVKLLPFISGHGEYSMRNESPHPMNQITTGNLRDISDIPNGRSLSCIEDRAEFLSNLLFTQWIVPMMPIIETYSSYKKLGLIVPTKPYVVQPGFKEPEHG